MRDKDKAAHRLEGLELQEGWRVVRKLESGKVGTGGVYSAYYEATDGERAGFLKAFDYSDEDKATQDKSKLLENTTTAFNYEKLILSLCTERGIKGVVRLLSTGWVDVPDASYPRVEYLILEFGEGGDCREMLDNPQANLRWKLKSLHQVASGLNQLHAAGIAHQDIKPSNIVNDRKGASRISDFGSAYLKNYSGSIPEHLTKSHCGTYAYAPPELLYGFKGDFEIRRRACDAYLLGSLIAFYFSRTPMNSLIQKNLDPRLSWTQHENQGHFDEVKEYVSDAFAKAVNDFTLDLEDGTPELAPEDRESLAMCVQYLCNPSPYDRGHPKTINERGSNYSLTRFVSILSRLAKKYDWKVPTA